MIVHLGVILIAVALAASNSYTHGRRVQLQVGQPVVFAGHTFELVDVTRVRTTPARPGCAPTCASTASRSYARRSPAT